MAQVFYNPITPYQIPLTSGFTFGDSLQINGTIYSGNEKRFAVDFMASNGSIPFHFNPRFGFSNQNIVVMNSSRCGVWQHEQQVQSPFTIGIPFELKILARVNNFEIKFNNYTISEFSYRDHTPIVTIRISGDIQLHQVHINRKFNSEGLIQPKKGSRGRHHADFQQKFVQQQQPMVQATAGYYGGSPVIVGGQAPPPPPYPGIGIVPTAPPDYYGNQYQQPYSAAPTTVTNPLLPCKIPIYGGFNAPRKVLIAATPQYNANRFEVNLMSNNDVIFHFNPRFPESTVVRNSQKNGSWQNEERNAPSFPFARNQAFTLEVIGGPHLQILVNGQHFTSFAIRDLYAPINGLMIGGDLNVHHLIIH